MSWIEVRLNFPQQTLEDVSAYLFAMGCEGVHMNEKEVLAYFNKHNWSQEIQTGLVGFISQIIPTFTRRDIQVKALSDFDWSTSWKQYFKPVRITSTIVVLPPWEEYPIQEGDVPIIINPQMAFGTGQHESTQLVIQGMAKWLKPGMQVLDVGTGSGILAIIADKLGAESVAAIDHDIEAVKNASENAVLNKVSGGMRIVLAELEQLIPQEFDLILANINKNALLKYAGLFPDFMSAQGKLILSGILATDDRTVVEQYHQQGFRLVSKHLKKEWLALVFEGINKRKKNEAGGNRPGNEFGPATDWTIS